MKQIKVVKISPKGLEVVEINNDLRTLQMIVGGYIEADRRTINEIPVTIISDEEGALKSGLKISARSMSSNEKFVGTILITSTRGENFASLTKKAIDIITNCFDSSTNILAYD